MSSIMNCPDCEAEILSEWVQFVKLWLYSWIF